MPKCFRCGSVLGVGNVGLIQENGTVLCPRCDAARLTTPPTNYLQRWMLCTLTPSIVVLLIFIDNAPKNAGVVEGVVIFASNVIAWGLLSGLGILIYKQLKA